MEVVVAIEEGNGFMCSEIQTVSQKRYRLRKACLGVGDVQEFHAGLLCGQATLAGKQGEVSDLELFALFEELLGDLEKSQTYLVGCLIGMVDALLQARRTLPPEYAALLQPLKVGR